MRGVLFGVLLCGWLTNALATSFAPENPDETIESAKHLCAVKLGPFQTVMKGDSVFTRSPLEVEKCFVGENLGLRPALEFPGGTTSFTNNSGVAEKITTSVPGLPALHEGMAFVGSFAPDAEQIKINIWHLESWTYLPEWKKDPDGKRSLVNSDGPKEFLSFKAKKNDQRNDRSSGRKFRSTSEKTDFDSYQSRVNELRANKKKK